MVAKALRKPVYVAAESYKFARLYPLSQRDIPETKEQQNPLTPLASIQVYIYIYNKTHHLNEPS